jgi:hypothetical protein
LEHVAEREKDLTEYFGCEKPVENNRPHFRQERVPRKNKRRLFGVLCGDEGIGIGIVIGKKKTQHLQILNRILELGERCRGRRGLDTGYGGSMSAQNEEKSEMRYTEQ